jgi:hypothetical protein
MEDNVRTVIDDIKILLKKSGIPLTADNAGKLSIGLASITLKDVLEKAIPEIQELHDSANDDGCLSIGHKDSYTPAQQVIIQWHIESSSSIVAQIIEEECDED